MSKRPTYSLKFAHVDPYPIVGSEFEVTLHLLENATTGVIKSVDGYHPVNLKLFYNEKPLKPCPDGILRIVTPSRLQIDKSGKLVAKVVLSEFSMHHENRKFVLQASADPLNGVYINPAISEPMLAIRHRLKIQNPATFPDIWYKDEGGRDKCIEIVVQLYDQHGNVVVDRKVPLKIALLYSGGHAVHNQDILKINPDNKLCIDESGQALLRFRIDDVSKNHQKQSFVIQIGPDTAQVPQNSDISPDLCPPVEVRSKRNKRMRDKEMMGGGLGALGDLPLKNPSLGYRYSNEGGSYPGSLSLTRQGESMQSINGDSGLMKPSLSNSVAPDITPQDHLNSVIKWTQFVLHKLSTIQWEQLGVDRLDGKPLYQIHNPNTAIAEIVTSYQESIIGNLSRLSEFVDNSGSDGEHHSDNGQKDNLYSSDDGNGSIVAKPPSAPRDTTFSSAIASLNVPTSLYRDNSLFTAVEMWNQQAPIPNLSNDVSWNLPNDLLSLKTGDSLNMSYYSYNANDEETAVYVLARALQIDGKRMGIPAFDRDFKLVCFYESVDEHGMSVVKQIKFNSNNYSPNVLTNASRVMKQCFDSKDKAIFTFDSSTPRVKIAENALIYSYSHDSDIIPDIAYDSSILIV